LEGYQLLPSGLDLKSPLWDFALSVYAKLSKPMLALQSKGARVNQMLAALWAAEQGIGWPGPIPEEIEQWHQQILPIRAQRIALKPQLEEYPDLESLYTHFKGVELNMERVELAMLYQWLQDCPTNPQADLLGPNLRAVLAGVDDYDSELSEILTLYKANF
jgi:uncharacterized protein (TIGR02444 family)